MFAAHEVFQSRAGAHAIPADMWCLSMIMLEEACRAGMVWCCCVCAFAQFHTHLLKPTITVPCKLAALAGLEGCKAFRCRMRDSVAGLGFAAVVDRIGRHWHVSAPTMGVVRRLLAADPAQRPTARQLFDEYWPVLALHVGPSINFLG